MVHADNQTHADQQVPAVPASGPVAHPHTTPPAGPWSPLRGATFRSLWLANLASNIGLAVHDLAAGWQMAKIDSSPGMVALVQAAAALPLFVFALPAGALADLLDRRRVMILVQAGRIALALLLAAIVLAGAITPPLLLTITFLMGLGAAVANPAWQTAMVDLVPRDQLHAASALNSVSLNISRAVGPAIGGLLVASAGIWAAFILNALCLMWLGVVLSRWQYDQPASPAAGERFASAMRAGLRYASHSRELQAVLARTGLFVVFASCVWGLMPVIAKTQLRLDASGYGVLLTCLGAGAVTAAFVLPSLRSRLSATSLVAWASLSTAAGFATLALTDLLPMHARWPVAFAAMYLCGWAWITMVTCVNVAAQTSSPAWVRARAFACYLATFFGSLALGSWLWGQVADTYGIAVALWAASIGLLTTLPTFFIWRLHAGDVQQHDPADLWQQPVVDGDIAPDEGPVVITVEYRVNPARFAAFSAAMAPIRASRLRDGAISWMLTRDTADPWKVLEIFVAETWGEHLRQHDRLTDADRAPHEIKNAFHEGNAPPQVRHFVSRPVPKRHAGAPPRPS